MQQHLKCIWLSSHQSNSDLLAQLDVKILVQLKDFPLDEQ